MKTFTTAVIRGLLNQVHREEISFSRMVEIMNERVELLNEMAEIVNDMVSEAKKPNFKEGKRWNAEKLCVEDIPEEPKKGDLAIFWDFNKEGASIGKYNQFIMNVSFPHRDHREIVWKNAIKFESKEQYEKLLKGEI